MKFHCLAFLYFFGQKEVFFIFWGENYQKKSQKLRENNAFFWGAND
jgi:hypothetical protein